MKKYFTIPVTLFILLFLKANAGQPVKEFGVHPNVFIENQGQVIDQYGNPNPEVLFIYNQQHFNLELKRDGFSLELFEVHEQTDMDESGKNMLDPDASDYLDRLRVSLTSHRVDVKFENANSNIEVDAALPIEGYFNYYFAPVISNRHINVKAFRKVTYHDLYPGIDFVFITSDADVKSPLRYEFIVHPGADLSKIKFDYEGAQNYMIDDRGNFHIETSKGLVDETRPKYFVEGVDGPLPANFIFDESTKSFSSLNYDRSKFLIIDPNMIWGTYYGGEKGDEVAEVAVGPDKMPGIAGHTISLNHIATTGAHQTTFAGGVYDFFVAKFNSDGTMYWSTYLGGADKDQCYGLGVDNANNLIVVGNALSAGLATSGAYQTGITGPKADILIAKFDPQGGLTWCTYFGGDSSENPRNVVTDYKDDIYIAGTTASITKIATAGAYQTYKGGFDDTWVAKFTAAGWPVWSTYYGDSGVDRSHALTLDLKGNLYVAGTTSSRDSIATPGVFHSKYAGGTADAYLSRWDTAGHFKWGTYLGGTEDDKTRGCETDSFGYVYLGGFSNSDSGVASSGSFQPQWAQGTFNGTYADDGYIAKFDSNGQRIWGTYYGGNNEENIWGMTIDKKSKSIYVAGTSSSFNHIAFNAAMQSSKSSGFDGTIGKFSFSCNIDWGSYWGGVGDDQMEDVAVDADGFVYVCGRVVGPDMITTPGVYQPSYYGDSIGISDAVLYKFNPENNCFDGFEPNESMTNPALVVASLRTDSTLADDTLVYGYNANIVNGNDQDWYQLNVEDVPNEMIILDMMTVNLDLRLYNHDGLLIRESNHSDVIPDTISVNNLPLNNYFIEIPHAPEAFDSLNCYRLRIYKSNDTFPPIGIVLGVAEFDPQFQIDMYPNPVKQLLTCNIPSKKEEDGTIVVHDLLGNIVYSNKIRLHPGTTVLQVPISNFSDGPYTLLVNSGSVTRVGKFVKQ